MIHRRGDVVLAFYPFASGAGGSRRPALIVQGDADNRRMMNTIVAQITTNLSRAGESTHVLIEVASPERRLAGLLHDSIVSCNNLATVHESLIQRKIGDFPAATMRKIDNGLKAALALP